MHATNLRKLRKDLKYTYNKQLESNHERAV